MNQSGIVVKFFKLKELNTLISECKTGNQKAYEVLYKKYYRVLYVIALRYCRTTFEAEDILQESYIKIFKNINAFVINEGSFEGWLKRIVQNTAVNHYRSNLKFNLNSDVTEDDLSIGNDSFDSLIDSFETKEILNLLDGMPEGYRLVINLYCIDGYSHKEISEMLNISIGTSKSQLFKAKSFLKKVIETQFKEKIV